MLDRRRVHGGGFIGLLLGKTLPCVFLKSRCYPTTSPWARGYPMELAHPAQTEFVICDYAIENSLHYVRDVTFGEDRSRIRTGNAPQVMAALRNLTITLIHRSGSSQIATSRRHFAFHPRQALDLLLQRRSSQPSFSTLGVRGLHGPFLFARAFCHTPSSEQFIPGLSRNHDSDTGWESSRADEPVKHQQAQTAMNSCKTPVPA